MKATMMLADFAQVADGKLNVIGAGWTHRGVDPSPFAIAMILDVPWDHTNVKHTFVLELVDADGNPVLVEETGASDESPLTIQGEFEVGRPPGLKPGTPISVPFALNIGPPPLQPAMRYEWRLLIDGNPGEGWRLPFETRAGQPPRVG